MQLNESDGMSDGRDYISIVEQKRLDYPRWGYTLVGIILLIVWIIAILENAMTLRIFATKKELRSPTNIFIIALSACDLCMALFGIPLAMSASFAGHWNTGAAGCEFEAFIVYVLGLCSVYILTAISIDRYIIIAKPLHSHMLTKRVSSAAVLVCLLLALFWACLPVFGWNGYGLEAPGISCGLQYHDHSPESTSYIVTIFVFCFIFPICIMVFCYYNVFMAIKIMGRSSSLSNASRIAKRNQRVERKMLKTCILTITSFWICWTPYAVVSFWQSFGNADFLPLTVTLVPAVAAKCQLILNPIIYVATNNQFRIAFFATIPFTSLRNVLMKGEDRTTPDIRNATPNRVYSTVRPAQSCKQVSATVPMTSTSRNTSRPGQLHQSSVTTT